MDDTGSSNPNTPVATPPSAGHGPGLGPGPEDRLLSAAASSTTAEGLLPPRRKRNRPAKSCLQCRQRKIKCDQKHPCGSCLRSKFDNCAYAQRQTRTWPPGALSPASSPAPQSSQGPQHDQQHHQQQQPLIPSGHHSTQYHHFHPHPHPPQQAQQHLPLPRTTFGNGSRGDIDVDSHHAYAPTPGPSVPASLPTPVTYPSPNSIVTNHNTQATGPDVVSRLEGIIQQLQQQLAQQTKGRDSSAGDRKVDGSGSGQLGEPVTANVRGVLSKSRYFGQSHCLNSIRFFPLITNVVEKLEKDNIQGYKPFMVKCKNLAKSIKQSRVGAVFSFDVGKSIPSEETVRRLLEAYFRTFETVYRILHVPTFWEEYRKYWEAPSAASQTFIIQMQLCMAIGACFQDDVTALRPLATQWIYEAQHWLAPPEKSRMNFATLQIMCLLHLARETCGIGGDLTWISSGSLMRCAMYMGLHHDPDHLGITSILRAELRRRLWATILEIALQSSLNSGGPPLISPSDYDTKQPANFDDDQLLVGEQSTVVPRPSGCFTQTSVQLTLLRSFPTRLSVAQYVNGFHTTASYEQTSRLNAQLQQVSATLQQSYDPAGVLPRRMTLFQLRLAEHMVHRFFLVLNQPCLGQARSNPDYWFARKACVESARKLCDGFSKATPAGESKPTDPVDDFVRLSIAGAGAFRSVPVQCMLIIGVELIWQALDDRSMRQGVDPNPAVGVDVGSATGTGIGVAPRGELQEVLQCCIGYQERRITCGETNVKGYIFAMALLTQVQALLRGASDSEVEQLILESVRTSLEHCWNLLKEVAGATATPPAQIEQTAENWTDIRESPDGSQNMGDVFGFGGGWDWDGDLVFDPFDSRIPCYPQTETL
ncbi:hypothetical protein BR93DRAFT_872536 [Coniochaeta sp. PMI_546]|nr:hypothetical protein BR93DRAFT_872536 [Coniochaeta sp. PMI_546]